MRKRSSWLSGSGKVPWCSKGFCVAMTMNGCASAYVSPSTVTCSSAIASSRADCVFGDARLISSPSSSWVNTGPGPELERSRVLVPHRAAEHVGGEEVRRELDPPEVGLDRAGERLGERCLPHARHIFEQQVPPCHHSTW